MRKSLPVSLGKRMTLTFDAGPLPHLSRPLTASDFVFDDDSKKKQLVEAISDITINHLIIKRTATVLETDDAPEHFQLWVISEYTRIKGSDSLIPLSTDILFTKLWKYFS